MCKNVKEVLGGRKLKRLGEATPNVCEEIGNEVKATSQISHQRAFPQTALYGRHTPDGIHVVGVIEPKPRAL
jgi:hypothetical protein